MKFNLPRSIQLEIYDTLVVYNITVAYRLSQTEYFVDEWNARKNLHAGFSSVFFRSEFEARCLLQLLQKERRDKEIFHQSRVA